MIVKQGMPEWLVERLDRAGYIDSTTAAGRQARATKCPDCHWPIIRGLTEFPGALSVDVDPPPLTATGEAVCLILGRSTYELRWLGNRYELDTRDQWRRRERPAGMTKQVDVLAKHICGKPPPPPHALTMLREPAPIETPEECPF